MQKIVNSRTNMRMAVALALSFAGVLACSSLVFGETQNADGNSESCNGNSSINYAPNSSNVCQSDTGAEYRFSRWVYYTVNTDNLPTESGKKYIPPIGIANSGNGIVGSKVDGWLVVEPAMSDCIVENGGFWRRGYFQEKNDIYQERDYKGLTFGATQNGVAPVGFTGRSSNNISSANEVGHNDSSHSVGEWYPTFSLGQQTLYVGDRTKVWAKMDTSAGMIDDAQAQSKLNEFANSGNPETLDYGDYFLSNHDGADAGNATVLFCYSDISPFDGVVKIGSDGSNYAFNSKKHGESKDQGTYKNGSKINNDNTIDLGVVNDYSYTPGYLLMQVSKANDKTGKTNYSAVMTLNNATKYAFDGSNWVSKDQAIDNTTSSTVTSSTSPSFVLGQGDNTICIALDYKEKQNDSSPQKLKACVKVKYVPLIANEIDSRTSAVASVSGVSTSGVSDPDNGNAGNPGINMDVPYGEDITVNWKHSLGIKRVEKDDGNHVALNPLMGKFRVKYAKLGESWATSGLSKELGSGTYNSGLDNFNVDNLYETDKVKLLPGDRKELLRGIAHPKTVKNDSAATSTGNESSSLKVTLTADTVKCSINGKDIGVNNPDNYAKMSLSVSAPYKSRTVGDGVDDSGNPYPSSSTVWLKGNDKIKKFSYSICDGAQIAKDRAWLDSNSSVTDWTSASVTDLDKFEISMDPLNNSLNGRLYNTNYNGLTPATSIKLSGIDGKNIRADEIGDNKYLQARVDAGYQLKDQDTVATTEASYQLGQTIEHSISFQTSNNDTTVKKYSITTKVPYNYIIDPGFDQFDGSSIYYGEDIS
ncbi:MAG: hypothetical protein Q4A96_04050, partial [Candidatus Saccharibacteria bacterium]|nr:hypothetical protein [Candidatus Saccharibacteria bacterium]